MSAPAWTTIENAIYTWVSSTGVTAAWTEPGAPRPAAPFVSMRLAGARGVGHDWLDVQDAIAPDPGAEIEHVVRGTRALTLSLQAFAAAGTGALGAVAMLEAVRTAARLPTGRDALNAAGVGVGSFDAVKAIDGVVNSLTFEPRAVCEVTLWVAAELVETSTYIEIVESEGTVD